jgi:hypothetical protein
LVVDENILIVETLFAKVIFRNEKYVKDIGKEFQITNISLKNIFSFPDQK